MSNVNFRNLCLKICMEKKNPVGPRFYWNLTSSISVYCSSMLSRTLDGLYFYAIECSEQVSGNFRNGKTFYGENFVVGNNFHRH